MKDKIMHNSKMKRLFTAISISLVLTSIANAQLFNSKQNQADSDSNEVGKTRSSVSREQFVRGFQPTVEITAKEAGTKVNGTSFDGSVIFIELDIKEQWSIYLTFSQDRKSAYLVFPCGELTGNKAERAFRLMQENSSMGTARFELRNNHLRIVAPCLVSDLEPELINNLLNQLIVQARRTSSLWANTSVKAESNQVVVEKPNNDLFTKKNNKNSSKRSETHSRSQVKNLNDVTICKLNQMRMGTMSIRSIKNKQFTGLINFAPNGDFSMSLTQMGSDGKIECNGSYEILDGELVLKVRQGADGPVVKFEYVLDLISQDGEIKLKSKNGLDSIVLPR